MVTRLSDVITDPLVGYWSDRLQHRISRWQQMLVGAIILSGGVYALFVPQQDWLLSQPAAYLLLFGFISFLGWILINVPYQALVAELTFATHIKTRLTSFREGVAVLGVMLALTLPLALGVTATDPYLFEILWWVLLLGLAMGLILLKWKVEPRGSSLISNSLNMQLLFKQIWHQHRWSLQLMPAYFVNNLANALPATLFLLFVSYGLQLESEAGLFLMIYFVSGVLALPVWFYLSRRIGKYQAWQISMVVASCSFVGVFALEAGDRTGYIWVCVLTGLSLGADIALPASLQADIAQKLSKQLDNVNGFLFGLWGLITKLALAMAVGLALPLLDFLQIEQQTDAAMHALWWLYAGIPIAFKLLAIYWLRRQSWLDNLA